MTDVVTPSLGGDSDPYQVAQVIKNAGANDPGWVVAAGNTVLGDRDSALSGAPFNGYAESSSGTSLDVTIDTGEAFVEGAWVARDVTTTVTLAASTATQTVYLGWDANAEDTAIIGLAGAFTSADPRMALYEFDTDASGVTAARTEHTTGLGIRQRIEGADNSTIGLVGLLGAASAYAGALGDSQAEVFRAPGGTSDALLSVNDGSGKVNLAYNCYFDGAWRYTVGSEPAYRVAFDGGVVLHAAAGGSADATITFNSFELDDTGDLFSDATQVYDASAGEVPQTRLGGPAASLSSYPVPAGDLADGAGSGLDADTVDGYQASELQGGQWTQIATFSDTNTGTDLSFDTGTLGTTYEIYKWHVVWVSHIGDEWNSLQARVQGDSTSNYHTLHIDKDLDVFRDGPNSQWQNIAQAAADGMGHAEITIRGGGISGLLSGDENVWPTFATTAGGHAGVYQGQTGHFTKDVTTVDRMEITSQDPATAKAKLLGMTL